jgi:hypothetical protein
MHFHVVDRGKSGTIRAFSRTQTVHHFTSHVYVCISLRCKASNGLVDLDELNLELEGGVGGNDGGEAAGAVSVVCFISQGPKLVAKAHQACR